MTYSAATRIACRALLASAAFGAFTASSLAADLGAKPAVIQDTPMTGGDGSVAQFDHNAYSLPLGNLPMTGRLDFSVGNSFFRNPWVVAPASTDARDGLGPLINTNSCQGCHIKDGRGHPPAEGERAVSLFLRLSMPTPEADGNADDENAADRSSSDSTSAEKDTTAEILRRTGVLPVPNYGRQLQNAAIAGARPEADLRIDYQPREVSLAGGETVTLRVPSYHIESPAYGDLPPELLTSPRVAPPMIGLGLLEAISDADILAGADPDDEDGNGISGRANQVWDKRSDSTQLGRFGWKAGEPSVEQQSLNAFAGDMGLTSSLVPHSDCMPSQGCDGFADGGTPEVSDEIADFITFYAQSLAVPQRRDLDSPAVMAGAKSFDSLGCSSCHTPQMRTASNAERPELADQIIWPYSDLLLHDMGEGLADGRSEYQASGTEWRTPPLWGIGLAQRVNPLAGFLHDGRARTLQEAILWHGGEAAAAIERYRQLSPEQRNKLITFLESL